MSSKTYPIGTLIKFLGNYEDCNGKVGRVVGIVQGAPLIYLPESQCVSCFSTKERPATVQCNWFSITPVVLKNQQLLFDFAY